MESLALQTGAEHDGAQDRTRWEELAAAVLRKSGRLAEDAPDSDARALLTRRTLDDVEVPPLGTPDLLEGLRTGGRPTRAGAWDVRTPLAGDDPQAVREAALVDLENGATSLLLDLGEGLDLDRALDGVLLDLAPVALATPTAAACEALAALLERYDGAPAPLTNLSADPETTAMRPHRVEDAWTDEAFVVTARRAQELGVLGVVVDGTALHDRGASDAQELGWSIAVGVHYLRVLTAAGLAVDEAAGLIEFRYAATDEQLPTIAKLRAARRLWARVLEASGGSDVAQRQHAVTSRPMMTRYDPWVNMLRTTVAAFAAGAGGADAVTVHPFDSRLGLPDAFGRRIARNTSSLLIEESHLGVVADPAGGSFAVERLTDDLAVAGWAELGRIEADGGLPSDAARDGVKARVRETVARRDAEVADRTRAITGVSEFPHLGETLPERGGPDWTGVQSYARGYEQMRDRPADRRVFLATMGPLAAHTARAGFATNLLAAGGVAVDRAGATDDAEQVVRGYDGQPVVCLAGTDAAYADWGAELVAALREAGATYVVLAGRPGERTGLGEDDVDDWAAVGSDALGLLGRVRRALGVEEEA